MTMTRARCLADASGVQIGIDNRGKGTDNGCLGPHQCSHFGRQDMFDGMDIEGKGHVDYTEFLAATLQKRMCVCTAIGT